MKCARYGISFQDDETTVYLHATNTVTEAPDDLGTIEGNAEVRGHTAFASTNDGIRVLSWAEGDNGYSLDVECIEATDERCMGTDYIVGVANRLVER